MPKTIIPEHLQRKSPRHGERSKKFRDLVQTIPIGQEFGRKEVKEYAGEFSLSCLMQTLIRYGYVIRVGRGRFSRVKDIPPLDSRRHFCKNLQR